jgi:hypothetical protein
MISSFDLFAVITLHALELSQWINTCAVFHRSPHVMQLSTPASNSKMLMCILGASPGLRYHGSHEFQAIQNHSVL